MFSTCYSGAGLNNSADEVRWVDAADMWRAAKVRAPLCMRGDSGVVLVVSVTIVSKRGSE